MTRCIAATFLTWSLVALSMMYAGTVQGAPITPGQPGAWLVFLCRASDATVEPRNPAFYQELFDPAKADLVHAFFKGVSFGKVDLSKSLVLGWFKMDVTTAEIAPAVRNNGTNPNRLQTAEDCKSAGIARLRASNQTIDPNAWAGFIAVINVNVDAGQAGRNVIANALEPASFYQHEMLHVMGQQNHTHSLPNDATPDHRWGSTQYDEYNDPWDVMSYDVGLFSFDAPPHGESGPLLNMAYRSLLGWLPTGRTALKLVRSDLDRSAVRVVLAPVSEPQWFGSQLAVVDLPYGVRYAIEYRKKSGFDRGILRGEVVVREWRSDQATYLVRQTNGHVGFYPGEPAFTDTANRLKVTVESISPNRNAATILIDPGLPLSDRSKCLATCAIERSACMAQVPHPGGSTPQQCLQQYNVCRQACNGID